MTKRKTDVFDQEYTDKTTKASKKFAKANFMQLYIGGIYNSCFVLRMQAIYLKIVESWYIKFQAQFFCLLVSLNFS